MAYATLGNITFERLYSPDTLRTTEGENYAVAAMATGKPRLQHVGSELAEISMTIRLNRQFCDPAAELEKIKTARTTATILPFTTGAGELLGNYVITQTTTSRTDLDTTGGLIEAMVDITLLEFYDPDEAATDEAEAQSAAFANDRRKVVPVQAIAQTPLPSAVVSQAARAAESHNIAALKETAAGTAAGAESASRLRRAQQQIIAARAEVEKVVNKLQENAALAAKAPEMLAAAQTVLAEIPGVLAAILSGDAAGAFARVDSLGALLQDMVRKGIQIELGILKRAE